MAIQQVISELSELTEIKEVQTDAS
jgi:hypothetical protein